jgi:hypothetical protein
VKVPIPKAAADALRAYERVIRDATVQREVYGSGVMDALGIVGTVTGFDETSGELILEDPPEPEPSDPQ